MRTYSGLAAMVVLAAALHAGEQSCTTEGCSDTNGKGQPKHIISFVDIKKTCYDVDYKTVSIPATVLPGDETPCGNGCADGGNGGDGCADNGGDGCGEGAGCGDDCGEGCGYKPGFLSRLRSALGMGCGPRTRCVASPKKSSKKIGEKCVGQWECGEDGCADNGDDGCADNGGDGCGDNGEDGCADNGGDGCGESCKTYKPGFMERIRKALGRRPRLKAAGCGEGCADNGGEGCADNGGEGCADNGGEGCADNGGDGCGESCKTYKPGFLARLRKALGRNDDCGCGTCKCNSHCGSNKCGAGEGCSDAEGCNNGEDCGEDAQEVAPAPPSASAGRVFYQY